MYKKHLREDQWQAISHALPGDGGIGRPANDNRRFVESIIWVAKNGAKWRSLPREYGNWNTAHRRFRRWSKMGIWQMIFNSLVKDSDLEWLMIDSTIIRAHQHSAGAKGGKKSKL